MRKIVKSSLAMNSGKLSSNIGLFELVSFDQMIFWVCPHAGSHKFHVASFLGVCHAALCKKIGAVFKIGDTME